MGDFTRICPESSVPVEAGADSMETVVSCGWAAAARAGEIWYSGSLTGLADANPLALALDLQLAHAALVE